MKKNVVILVVIAAVLMAALIFLYPAIKSAIIGISLEYQFAEGKQILYDSITKIETTYSAAENNINNFPANQQAEIQSLITLEVSKSDEIEKEVVLLYTSEIKKMFLSTDGQKQEIEDSFINETQTTVLKLADNGRIIENQTPDGSSKQPFMINSLLLQAIPLLPDKPVKTGESWQEPVHMDLDMKTLILPFKGVVNCSLERIEEINDNKCAVIAIKGSIETDPEKIKEEPSLYKSAELNLEGKILFDMAKGEVMLSNRNFTLTMTHSLPPSNIPVKMVSKYNTELIRR